MKKIIGIDLGTSNTIIYVPKKGIVFNEPTVVALNKDNKKVESYGYLAFKLLGKESSSIEVIKPMKNGVIADGPATVSYLTAILSDLKLLRYVKNSTIIFSCPSEFSQIERSALRNVGRKLKCNDVIMKSSSFFTAIGGNKDGSANKGTLVLNIGGGISDISILTNGEAIISKSCSFSGQVLDNAIIRHLRKNHHILIGTKTAEYIKMKIGSVEFFPENRLLEVSGIDIVSSLPHSVVISTAEIKSCILPCFQVLVDTLLDCLELTPPEVASDLIESGLLVGGGGALLAGLREYLENALNMAIRILPEPGSAVSQGIKILMHQELSKDK